MTYFIFDLILDKAYSFEPSPAETSRVRAVAVSPVQSGFPQYVVIAAFERRWNL